MPLLPWVLLGVAAGLAGLTALAVLSRRVYAAARELGHEVERSRRLLEPKLTEFGQAAGRAGRRASPDKSAAIKESAP